MLAHKLGLTSRKTLKDRMLKAALGALPREAIVELSLAFVEKSMSTRLRRKAVETINRHKADGDLLVLATASVDFYAKIFAERLGFDICVSTLTTFSHPTEQAPQIAGKNCYGPDKLDMVVSALRALTGEKRSQQHWTFYSDHYSDFALLTEADSAFVITPGSKSKKAAIANNFPILDW